MLGLQLSDPTEKVSKLEKQNLRSAAGAARLLGHAQGISRTTTGETHENYRT